LSLKRRARASARLAFARTVARALNAPVAGGARSGRVTSDDVSDERDGACLHATGPLRPRATVRAKAQRAEARARRLRAIY